MSRRQAKATFNLEEFKAEMAGIYSTTINLDTIDEAPMAYKNMDDIVANIEPTAEIVKIIKPIFNFKAGDE
jgi:RNA-splicing ligase RtcB